MVFKKLSASDRRLWKGVQEASTAGDLRATVRKLQRLVSRRPDIGMLHAFLADALADLGRTKEAEVEFRRAVELSPDVEVISLNLFHLLWGQGRYEEALEEAHRFMFISDSKDYREIVKEINEKW